MQNQLIELQQQLGPEFNNVLLESIDATITALFSRGVLDALYANLQTRHSISRGEMPYRLDVLFAILEKLFGVSSSQTITKAIARTFYIKLGLEFTANSGHTLIEYVDEAAEIVIQRAGKSNDQEKSGKMN